MTNNQTFLSSQALNTFSDVDTVDLSSQEEEILSELVDFFDGKLVIHNHLWRSDYFGTGKIGAFHTRGEFDGLPAVVKVQGAKPLHSESWMIKHFNEQNQSSLIRAPKIYAFIPWDNQHKYEVLITEYASGEKILHNSKVLSKMEISSFFDVYQEYRLNCLTTPWLPQPEKGELANNSNQTIALSKKIKPHHHLRQTSDLKLVEKATHILDEVWKDVDLEFQHGHFSAEDLIRQNDQVVLFSNLFWKWKYPFYDAVFAYHWVMLTLASIKDISPSIYDQQKHLWLTQLNNLPQAQNPHSKKLLQTALLERAIAGLLVDDFAYIDVSNPLLDHIVSTNRTDIKQLTSELSKT